MVSPRCRLARAAAALVLTGGIAAGCGSASEPSPPTGVDELVIPTPSPDPADFVPEVGNDWLPLAPGATWTYADGTVLTVEAGVDHGGVRTTVLATMPAGDAAATVRDHLAEDEAGNVWLFGRQTPGETTVTWFAEPGLVVPAEPRFGDGWVVAEAPGLLIRAEVAEVGDEAGVAAGDFADVVDIELVVGESDTTTVSLARGVGPVRIGASGLETVTGAAG